ncbi:MAG: toll/interleukin-1 receptor domain-containing protein [Bryobacteraceae bacterium]
MSPTETPHFDVFLSYHSGDAAWVTALRSALVARNLKVWLDADQILPGDRYAEVLERGLEASRSVALIVSSGSLQSNWVKEEYYRALGLANSNAALRLIPVLIEAVPVPGFLSSRSWADFRDPSKFDESLNRLCLGITGSGVPPPADVPARPSGMDELHYLDNSLQREQRTVTQLGRLRWIAPAIGLLLFAIFSALTPGLETPLQFLAGVGSVLVTGLIGWGATARQLSASEVNIQRLNSLKDGLDLCMSKAGAGCPLLWTEFWRVVHRSAGLDTA